MDFRVTIEQPRDIKTRQDAELVVDRFTTFIYGVKVKNERNAPAIVRTRLAERVKMLRKQGLRITMPQLMKADLEIERV